MQNQKEISSELIAYYRYCARTIKKVTKKTIVVISLSNYNYQALRKKKSKECD